MTINYARHRVTKDYVFFTEDEMPPDSMLDVSWVWYRPPRHPRSNEVLLIGESMVNRFDRLGRH